MIPLLHGGRQISAAQNCPAEPKRGPVNTDASRQWPLAPLGSNCPAGPAARLACLLWVPSYDQEYQSDGFSACQAAHWCTTPALHIGCQLAWRCCSTAEAAARASGMMIEADEHSKHLDRFLIDCETTHLEKQFVPIVPRLLPMPALQLRQGAPCRGRLLLPKLSGPAPPQPPRRCAPQIHVPVKDSCLIAPLRAQGRAWMAE